MSEEESTEPSLFSPRIMIPFVLISLIWGSTWLVIKDQISEVPVSWSVSYRFIIAAVAMFALAAFKRLPFRLDAVGYGLALILGFFQFTFNFNFVYNAEMFITSGLVAVLFALLMVPNAIMGRIFLGHKFTAPFLGGSAIAAAGIALLFWHEYRSSPASLEQVLLGAALTFGGIMSASVANVMQAGQRLKSYPIITVLAWAMLFGALINVGPGKAAYTSVLVPVVAMILSTIFEGYVWTGLAATGAVLAMLGLLVALRARKPKLPRIPA